MLRTRRDVALKGAWPPLPVTTATVTPRPCSQQEILEEVVRELHKVKEEIIDGEWRPTHPDPATGQHQARLTPMVLGEGRGACAQGCKPGARTAQPARLSSAGRLKVCAKGFRSSPPTAHSGLPVLWLGRLRQPRQIKELVQV